MLYTDLSTLVVGGLIIFWLKVNFCLLDCGCISAVKHAPYIFKLLGSSSSTTLKRQINKHYHQQFKSIPHKETQYQCVKYQWPCRGQGRNKQNW
jgi:hypothetical protein